RRGEGRVWRGMHGAGPEAYKHSDTQIPRYSDTQILTHQHTNARLMSFTTAPPSRRELSTRLFVVLMLAPAAIVVLAVVAYPFFYNVVLSLSNMNIYHI